MPETPTPTPTTPTPTTPTQRPAPPRRGQTCDLLPSSGPGSSAALADQRVATALADIPKASTFVSAIEKADFTAKFNDENDITVFVPVNKAFDTYGGSKTEDLFADKEALISFLAYTVVNGRKTPADLTDASLRTKQGGDLEAKNVNGKITLNGTAKVLCSNIQTANANVYLIDTVLPPPE
ncbi:fasciclin domain-containing protein [Nonomuraea glycinis]|uniref:fasciclin domain-containing protein n=1 Tax=Nonomuraea glycinis TaxID=2047744 RepID=UPI0033B970D0